MSVKSEQRRKFQLDFLARGENIIVGDEANLPAPLSDILKITKEDRRVEKYFSGGLTAEVYKLKIGESRYTLKKKRLQILVENVDGQTSFLNEVQRRRDFEKLKKINRDNYSGIVDTIYANLNCGVILSKWIEGREIEKYDGDIIESIFFNLYNIEIGGVFECDPSNGNLLLSENNKVVMFDFGYAYPFNYLTDFNADGIEEPLFHLAERFETRCFFQHLLDIQKTLGTDKALSLFKIEKEIALKYYSLKLDSVIKNNGENIIIEYLEQFTNLWRECLNNTDKLLNLYNLESFRSFLLDVHDDLSGKSCTPDTLEKINEIIGVVKNNYDFIKSQNALFFGDEKLGKKELLIKYENYRNDVISYQLKELEGFNLWKNNRIEKIKKNY